MDLMIWWILLIVVLGVVSTLVARHRAQQRQLAMQAFAAGRDFTYTAQDPSLVDRFHDRPFGRGFGRRATNVVHGHHEGRPVVAFDYSYKQRTGSGKNRRTTTYRYSVVAVHLDVLVPDLSVTPEGFFGRVVGRLTDTDIQLESEDFNRAFTVTSADRRFASDVLHPPVMHLLLQHPDVGWRFERDSMVVATRGVLSAEAIDARLALMDAVVDAIPGFVWQQLRGS